VFSRSFVSDTYACIPGRGTHRAAARFRHFVRARGGVGYVLQSDIRSYFASVDHDVMMGLVARRVADERLFALVGSLIVHGCEAPGRGMPIGNLTSQLFANLYLDPFDHFVKETLRVRHYLRYMDDFVLLAADRDEARARLAAVEAFLRDRLRLELNPRRIVVVPLGCARDFLCYVYHANGRTRVRRRSARRLGRRLPALARGLGDGTVEWRAARASVASWFGLAKQAQSFRLSRSIFGARDVRNIGKRLLVRSVRAVPRALC
jgi:hypothetical protein